MSCPANPQAALKEWAVVCDALRSGRQIILLRKGGIYEAAGEFEIEHRQFLLFPTFVHQNPQMLKPNARVGLVSMASEPAKIELSLAATITDIIPMPNRSAMDALDDQHIWTKPLIDMRFNYRPENPLYLLLIRAYQLDRPATIDNTPAYAGCKSWVPLQNPIETQNVRPVLEDGQFASRRKTILDRLANISS